MSAAPRRALFFALGAVFGAAVATLLFLSRTPETAVVETREVPAPRTTPAETPRPERRRGDVPTTDSPSGRVRETPPAPEPASPTAAVGTGALRVRIDRPSEQRWDTVFVLFRRFDGDTPPDGPSLLARSESTAVSSGVRDSVFHGLAQGRYAVGLALPLRPPTEVRTVDVGAGETTVDLRAPELPMDKLIVLHVLGPDGAPPPATELVNVYVGWRGEGGTGGTGAASIRRADGSFLVVPPLPPEGTRGYVQVALREGARSVDVDADTRELTVRFDDAARLVVTVDGYLDGGLEDAPEVVVVPADAADEDDVPRPVAEARQRGDRRTFGGLSPGRYAVLLVAGPGTPLRPIARQDVVVTPGANVARIRVPALATAQFAADAGKFQFAHVGPARLPGNWSHGDTPLVAADGTFRVERFAPGRVLVQLYLGEDRVGGEAVVELPQSGTIRVQPRPIDALRVTIEDASGAMAKAGLETGDLVYFIDDKSWTTSAEALAVVRAAARKPSVMLSARRAGGRYCNASADAKALGPPSVAGGYLEFATNP